MADRNGDGIEDPWEPHWLDDPHPEDKAALQTTFAGIHPQDVIAHDLPSELAAGLGLPGSLVDQAAATAPTPANDPNGWNPAFTAEPAPAAPNSPTFAPLQPGTGLPTGIVDQVAAPPGVGELLGGGPNAIADTHLETNAERYSGDPLANPVESERDAAAAEMAQRDPVAFAALDAQHQLAAANHLATRLLTASEDDRRQAEENLANRRRAEAETKKKMDAVSAQAAEVYARKIDPGRYMRTRSTGRYLLDLVGAIAGGIAATRPGADGRNHFVDSLMRHVDQDIDAQKADIENATRGIGAARGLLADEYARTGDLYQSAEAVRIAAKTAARDQILTEQQLYDPRGTRFLALGRAAADMTSRIAAGQQALAEKHLESEIKIGDHNLKVAAELRAQRAAEEAQRHNLALEAAKAAAKAGAGGAAVIPSKQAFAAKNHLTSWGAAERAMYEATVAKLRANGAGGTAPAAPTSSGTGKAAALAGAPAVSAAPATATTATTYKTNDEWFSENAPTASDVEKKQYWFVDGKHGSEAPPILIEGVEDPQKFGKRQRIRQQMGEKAGQLLVLMGRLQKKGLWSTLKNKVNWAQDEDAMEARSLAEELTGDAIQAKEMGVPSGNDVERVKTMFGGDPAGWKDQTPALQRARESMQIDQDRDWNVNAPSAAKDPSYNKYRVLPGASPTWLKKVEGRGVVKDLAPELPNTDPKQLKPKAVEGDAPNVEDAAAQKERVRNLETAADWLEGSGAVPSADVDIGAAALGIGKSSQGTPTPQVRDFTYRGAPEGNEAFSKLRTQYVNSVSNLNEYQRTGDPKLWKAFEQNQAQITEALRGLITLDDIPPKQRMSWRNDPSLVAHLAGVVLRRGGTR